MSTGSLGICCAFPCPASRHPGKSQAVMGVRKHRPLPGGLSSAGGQWGGRGRLCVGQESASSQTRMEQVKGIVGRGRLVSWSGCGVGNVQRASPVHPTPTPGKQRVPWGAKVVAHLSGCLWVLPPASPKEDGCPGLPVLPRPRNHRPLLPLPQPRPQRLLAGGPGTPTIPARRPGWRACRLEFLHPALPSRRRTHRNRPRLPRRPASAGP